MASFVGDRATVACSCSGPVGTTASVFHWAVTWAAASGSRPARVEMESLIVFAVTRRRVVISGRGGLVCMLLAVRGWNAKTILPYPADRFSAVLASLYEARRRAHLIMARD